MRERLESATTGANVPPEEIAMKRDLPKTGSISLELLCARVEAIFEDINRNAVALRTSLQLRSSLMTERRRTLEQVRELKAQTLEFWGEPT
jgi:hypothetical protein